MTALLVLVAVHAALAAACLLASGRDLRRGALLLVVVTAPLEVYRTDVGGVNLSLLRLSLAVALVVALRSAGLRRIMREARRNPLVLAYGGLAALMALSLATTSDNAALGARVLAQVGVGIALIAVVSLLAAGEPLPRLAAYLLAGACIPLVAAAWQQVAPEQALPLLGLLPVPDGLEVTRGAQSLFEGTARARGTFGDPSHFGAYLIVVGAVAAASAIGALRRGAARAVVVPAALALCVLAALAGTYSRSAWLGCMAAVAVVAAGGWRRLAMDRDATRRAAVLPLALALAVIAAAAPFASAIDDRLDPSSPGNVESNAVHERTITVALDDVVAWPATGVGLADLGPQLGQDERSSGAHSSYLTVAAELGLPGLALLLLGLILALRMLRRRAAAATGRERLLVGGLAAGYVGFAVANLTYDLWWDDVHWVVLGVAVAACAPPRPDGDQRSPNSSPNGTRDRAGAPPRRAARSARSTNES